MRVRVKICGITRTEDARVAAYSGADAVGLVFYGRSPRRVTVAQAISIVNVLPPFVVAVGLFVDEQPEFVHKVIAQVPLTMLQFHGNEAAVDCRSYGLPYIKAVHMREGIDLAARAAEYTDAAGLLVDTYKEEMPGGTGESFDWTRLPVGLSCPLILAGGLNADNVSAAVARVRPWAVDVSGGVETAPGIKDPRKIAAFIKGVYSVKMD